MPPGAAANLLVFPLQKGTLACPASLSHWNVSWSITNPVGNDWLCCIKFLCVGSGPITLQAPKSFLFIVFLLQSRIQGMLKSFVSGTSLFPGSRCSTRIFLLCSSLTSCVNFSVTTVTNGMNFLPFFFFFFSFFFIVFVSSASTSKSHVVSCWFPRDLPRVWRAVGPFYRLFCCCL